MDRLIYSLTTEHDWRWTLAAAAICMVGVAAAFQLMVQARRLNPGPRRRRAILSGAFVGGLSIFATHFVAMQGYQASGELRYGLWLTLASFGCGVGGIALAAALLMRAPTRFNRAASAVLGLGSVAVMHFLGIAALSLPGRLVWDPGAAIAEVAGAIALAGIGGAVVYGPGRWRFAGTSMLGAASVLLLHFGAMAAMTVEPGATRLNGQTTLSAGAMLAIIGAAIVGAMAVGGLLLWAGFLSRSGALRQMREAVDAMPDAMAFYDADHRLVLWNNRYAEVNPELTSSLVVGMSFREILKIGLTEGLYEEARGREDAWIEERLKAREALSATLEQRIAGDRWLRVADRKTAGGGTVTVCTDITDLKRDAAALAEARDAAQAASVSKSQFLANMSHEIRTPLNGVIGVAQALAAGELKPDQREMVELIQSSGRTLQVLLSDILDLARVESGRLELAEEAFDLGRAVREAGQLYEAGAGEKGLHFFVEVDAAVEGWVVGDMVRIKQILTNLVSNAVKFTSQGFVGLSVGPGPMRAGQPTLRFAVEDTGIGFDAETRDRLFSRFEQADGAITRKFGGTGLGLAISRQLAEMMGGCLDCESEPGGGSAFMLTVPHRPTAAPEPCLAPVNETARTARSVRVLMADDHPVNRRVVEMILAQADVALTSVEDGAQAVQAVRDGDFDLILMDMQMPVMDGLTATREIRLHEAALGLVRTPVVMLTANALAEHVAAAAAAGADRHLAKPFDAADLLALVAEAPVRAERSIAA